MHCMIPRWITPRSKKIPGHERNTHHSPSRLRHYGVGEPREWALYGILQREEEGKTQPKCVVFRKKQGRNIERKYQFVGGYSLTMQETTILYSGQNSPPTRYHCPKLLNPIFSNPAPSLIHLHSLHFQFFPLSLNFFTFHSTPPNIHCNTHPLQRFSESLASSSTTETLCKT